MGKKWSVSASCRVQVSSRLPRGIADTTRLDRSVAGVQAAPLGLAIGQLALPCNSYRDAE